MKLSVIVISKNQADTLPDMVYALRAQLSHVPRLFVLDRCTDTSAQVLKALNENYVIKEQGEGFEAGAARDFGMNHLEYRGDFIFFDGDRIPSGLDATLVRDALVKYDMCLVRAENDLRPWFTHSFTNNPNFGRYMNDTYTAGFTMTNKLATMAMEFNGGRVFHPIFDGLWGYEDLSLGDIAFHKGCTCGGFPKEVLINGAFETQISREHFVKQMSKRIDVLVAGGAPAPTWSIK